MTLPSREERERRTRLTVAEWDEYDRLMRRVSVDGIRLELQELLRLKILVAKAGGDEEQTARLEAEEQCYHGVAGCTCFTTARERLSEDERQSAGTVAYIAQQLHRDPDYDIEAWRAAKQKEREEREQAAQHVRDPDT